MMAVRLCRAHPPRLPIRIPARHNPPSRRVPVRLAPPVKPILAYEIVTIPPWEVLHENFQNRTGTQPIVEDPYLDQRAFIPSVLENFASREMLHGMIKVELTLMVWGFKDLDLPKEVCDLIISNLSESITESTRLYKAHSKKTIKYIYPAIKEPQQSFNLNEKPI